jgi:glycosyltransferase involved in cell wall biosynthesis
MTAISGFTYVRNGFDYGYPFLASIQSILPIVDELIVVVGDSTDGTREAIEKIGESRIKIVDSVWNEDLRKNGKVFAQQSNLGIEHLMGDWCFHIQADEVIHESDLKSIGNFIKQGSEFDFVDGLLFKYYHFWGDYKYIRDTRNVHRNEIRAFKNRRNVFSYKDSQGFRKFKSFDTYNSGEKGEKLKVLNTEIPIYHYAYVRDTKLMKKRMNFFYRFYYNDSWLSSHTNERAFDYNEVDKLTEFKGSHPVYMHQQIKNKNWDFIYDPKKSNMSTKDKILGKIEDITNYRLFEYKNYRKVSAPV